MSFGYNSGSFIEHFTFSFSPFVQFYNNNVRNLFGSYFLREKMYRVYNLPEGITNIYDLFLDLGGFNQNVKLPLSLQDANNGFALSLSFNQNILFSDNVLHLTNTFHSCWKFNQNIYIPSNIISLNQTFSNCYNFNQNINIMHCNNLKYMYNTFNNTNFSYNIQIPNCVEYMVGTFQHTPYEHNFNFQIMQNLKSMALLFNNTKIDNKFNIFVPNTVTNLSFTFAQCNNFNQPIAIPPNVVNMAGTFYKTGSRNKNITGYNIPINIPNSVTNTSYLFYECIDYNYPINIPKNCTNCMFMFAGCINFNKPIKMNRNVYRIRGMFQNCHKFNSTNIFKYIYEEARSTNTNDLSYVLDNAHSYGFNVEVGADISYFASFRNCWNIPSVSIYPHSCNYADLNSTFENCANLYFDIHSSYGSSYSAIFRMELYNTFLGCKYIFKNRYKYWFYNNKLSNTFGNINFNMNTSAIFIGSQSNLKQNHLNLSHVFNNCIISGNNVTFNFTGVTMVANYIFTNCHFTNRANFNKINFYNSQRRPSSSYNNYTFFNNCFDNCIIESNSHAYIGINTTANNFFVNCYITNYININSCDNSYINTIFKDCVFDNCIISIVNDSYYKNINHIFINTFENCIFNTSYLNISLNIQHSLFLFNFLKNINQGLHINSFNLFVNNITIRDLINNCTNIPLINYHTNTLFNGTGFLISTDYNNCININLDNNFNRLLVNCWNFNSQININSNDLSAINGMFIDCCNFNSSVNFYTNYISFSYIFINCPNYGANTYLYSNNVLNIYYPFSNLQKRVNVFIYNNILSNFVNAKANNNGVNQIWLYDINTKELLLKGDIE